MKFGLATYGTRGDVAPSITVGRELLRIGRPSPPAPGLTIFEASRILTLHPPPEPANSAALATLSAGSVLRVAIVWKNFARLRHFA
jgi:hypothetical protein